MYLIALLIAGLTTAAFRLRPQMIRERRRASAPAPQEAVKEPAPPPSVTVIGARDALGILGRDVRSPANENMGRIVDVIVDREGTVRAAVIDFGGFLGVGSRKIVVDWNALHFGSVANKRDSITLELTKEQVTAAPEYKEDAPVIVLGAAGRLQPLGIRSLEGETVWPRVHPNRSTGLTTIAMGDPPVAAMLCRCRQRPAASRHPSRESQRGLDWFIFFLADVQTGFGPFIAVYLTTQKWTQVEIGFVLSIGGIVGLLGQMPGGAIVDAARSERLVAGLAVATIGCSALAYALWPIFPVVTAAATLHALASCVLGPAIAAISLGLVGPLAIGERLGRNARFASLGNGSAAARDGRGRLSVVEPIGVFRHLPARDPDLAGARADPRAGNRRGAIPRRRDARGSRYRRPPAYCICLRQRPLLIFAGGVLLFQLANAAMLPLMAGVVTTRSSQWAPVLIAACIIVPQAIVALTSPSVGRKAQAWGRRPLLLLAFGALAIRGLLFAVVSDPYLLVAVQVFDGITAAVLSVMVPLIVADVAFGSGHFNLAQGVVGTATGIGASLSTVLAGYISDTFGSSIAFTGLAGDRGARPDGDLAVHAGDAANGLRWRIANHATMEGAIVLRYSAL